MKQKTIQKKVSMESFTPIALGKSHPAATSGFETGIWDLGFHWDVGIGT